MPSSVLLPTPLPPKRPMRWPRPQVSSASMARTPVPIGVDDRIARERVERRRIERRVGLAAQRAEAVERTAEAVEHAAEQRRPDRNRRGAAARDEQIARADAGGAAERHRLQVARRGSRRPRASAAAVGLRSARTARRRARAALSTRRAGRPCARPGRPSASGRSRATACEVAGERATARRHRRRHVRASVGVRRRAARGSTRRTGARSWRRRSRSRTRRGSRRARCSDRARRSTATPPQRSPSCATMV